MSSVTTDIFVAKTYLANDSALQNFMPYQQRFALMAALDGEEGGAIAELVIAAKKAIANTPKTYETENVELDDKVVCLHYFKGSVDAWIIERDVGDAPLGDALGPQIQAFGFANLYGDGFSGAELGYISIQEMIENNVELDLHWAAKTVKELRGA